MWTNASSPRRTVEASTRVHFRSPPLDRGGTYTFRVTTPGTINYTATAKPTIDGAISVIP